jgi:hypothetical protein
LSENRYNTGVKSDFSQWLERQYLAWQASEGKRRTIGEFSSWLGFKQPIVTMWMNGDRKPGQASADRLAIKLGGEVYALLGLQPSDNRLVNIQANWPHLTDAQRASLDQLVTGYLRENAQKYLAPGSDDSAE